GDATVTGGVFNNNGLVSGAVNVNSGGDFQNKATGVINGLVTIGLDESQTKSTFANAGTVNNDVTVHGGDGSYTAGQWDFRNTGTVNGNVTADDWSFSSNAGSITGDVNLSQEARFDNELSGIIGGTVWVASTATFNNDGTVGGVGVDGGIVYNSGTVGNVTVINSGVYNNHNVAMTNPGTVTGDVVVG